MAYVREYTKAGDIHPSDRLLMILNNSDAASEISIPIADTPVADIGSVNDTTGKKASASISNGAIKLSVAPRSVLIYELK